MYIVIMIIGICFNKEGIIKYKIGHDLMKVMPFFVCVSFFTTKAKKS